MHKVHQNIILDGQQLGAEARIGSKFTNEGKWENFIKPLLPEGEVFVEFGSNVGMFLKLARQKYDRVIGLERSSQDIEVALKYRGKDNYELIHAEINKYDLNKLPLADVILLANFHYHQHISEWKKLLDVLENRACYVIIVSVEEPLKHWRAQPHAEDVKSYFRHWELVKEVKELPLEGDPHPRRMYSMLFKSPKIERVKLEDIHIEGGLDSRSYDLGADFVKSAIAGRDPFKSEYYEHQRVNRQKDWSRERMDKFIQEKYNLVRSISEVGLKEPLLLDRNGRLVDGIHRFITLKTLNKSAIIRRL